VTLDQKLMVVEIFLLVLVIIQGEFIRYYEREVHRIQSEREGERKTWRDQKRKQIVKKLEPKEPDGQSQKVRVDVPATGM
jgi:hypothetical protein